MRPRKHFLENWQHFKRYKFAMTVSKALDTLLTISNYILNITLFYGLAQIIVYLCVSLYASYTNISKQ